MATRIGPAGHRRGGRAVECAGLENQCPATRDRGFESRPLRLLDMRPDAISVWGGSGRRATAARAPLPAYRLTIDHGSGPRSLDRRRAASVITVSRLQNAKRTQRRGGRLVVIERAGRNRDDAAPLRQAGAERDSVLADIGIDRSTSLAGGAAAYRRRPAQRTADRAERATRLGARRGSAAGGAARLPPHTEAASRRRTSGTA